MKTNSQMTLKNVLKNSSLTALFLLLPAGIPAWAGGGGSTSTMGGGDWLITAESLLPEQLEVRTLHPYEWGDPIKIGDRRCFGVLICDAYVHFTELRRRFARPRFTSPDLGVTLKLIGWGNLRRNDRSSKVLAEAPEEFELMQNAVKDHGIYVSGYVRNTLRPENDGNQGEGARNSVTWEGKKIPLSEFFSRLKHAEETLLRQLDFSHLETLAQLQIWDDVKERLLIRTGWTMVSRADGALKKRIWKEGSRLYHQAGESVTENGECDTEAYTRFRTSLLAWNHDGGCKIRSDIKATLELEFEESAVTCEQVKRSLSDKLLLEIFPACSGSEGAEGRSRSPIELFLNAE